MLETFSRNIFDNISKNQSPARIAEAFVHNITRKNVGVADSTLKKLFNLKNRRKAQIEEDKKMMFPIWKTKHLSDESPTCQIKQRFSSVSDKNERFSETKYSKRNSFYCNIDSDQGFRREDSSIGKRFSRDKEIIR